MPEQFRRRRLPHWDRPGGTYFITTCLAGSIPAQGLLDIRAYHDQLLANRPREKSPEEWSDVVWKKTFVQREGWLDVQPAVRYLELPGLAACVTNSLWYFHDQRYELIAFVVMPSHFHWLFRPLNSWAATISQGKSPREVIMHSIKSYTAHECNCLRGEHGAFWQDESYDHCVRDEGELERIFDYIELNPVKAGLCARREEWRYSSAYSRNEP
jgi:REP-associated tyrosine transposase